MEHLPPVGWADVATKRDLDHLASELRLGLKADMFRQLLAMAISIVAANAVVTGMIVGVARLG